MKTLLPLLAFALLLSAGWHSPQPARGASSPDTTYADSGYTRDTTGFYPVGDTSYVATSQYGDWTWRTLDSMMCRDGSPTGYAVRPAPSYARRGAKESVLVILQGGGACFDWATCYATPLRFGPAEFAEWASARETRGILSDRAANPFAEWNVVFVPYCTGDIHGGSNPHGQVERHPRQRFVGRENLRHVIEALSPLMRRVRHVVLAGQSAGGYGTQVNWQYAQSLISGATIDAYADCSGLPADTLALTTWTTNRWKTMWGLVEPEGCDDEWCATLPGWLAAQAASMPASRLAISGSLYDQTMRAFLGHDGTCDFGCDTDSLVFRRGLFALRNLLPANVGTFYRESTDHCMMFRDVFFEATTSEGVRLTDFLIDSARGTLYHTPANE